MKIKKIFQLIILFILPLTFASIFVAAQDNYEIATKQDFVDYLLSEDANMYGSYILVNDLDFTTGTVVYNNVTYELDSSGLLVAPIGERQDSNGIYQDSFHNPFKGTFNGAGHVIKGLNIRSRAIDNEYVGLFGYNEGIISQLGLVDSTVDGEVYVGGITGYNIGLIVGCYNTSSITGNGSVGGITGINYGYIRNCYNTGYVGGATKIGGIVGHNSSVVTAVYDLGIISGQLTEEGIKEYGYIFGYNNSQGVIGFVEDDNGPYQFSSSQHYNIAGAYYCSEYDFGVGYNIGYLKDNERHYDNVKTYVKTLAELKDINTYDEGFKAARTNIYPIGSSYSHRTTGFYIKASSGEHNYPFPVVGSSEYTSKHHQENSLHTNGYEGVGTIYNPFIITNETGLNDIRYSLTAAFKLGNNITLTKPFLPIGNETETFKGIIDGNGKRITNLMITDIDNDYVGLFAFNSGIIHNLSLDVNIDVPNASRVGGLAGFNNGQIREVYVKGIISGFNTVGGITGSNELGSIKNSYNQAQINGVMDIGGISGYNSGLIENVYSRTIPALINGTSGNVGGIVGFNENSKASGVINNGYHISENQIGYQSSIDRSFNTEQSRFSSQDDFQDVNKFKGFDIRILNKGQAGNTIWAVEEGVNNNEPYLVKTPPIRINTIAFDYNLEIEINDKFLRLFDYENRLVLGADIYLDKVWINLDSLLNINPEDAENKLIHWEIIYQMPNDGRSDVIRIVDNEILGISTGRATIRCVTDEGAKSLDLEVLVLGNVTDVYLVNKENGSHENPSDLVPDTIIVENFTNIQLFTEILPITSDSYVIWSSSNEQIATIDRNGNVYIHYQKDPNNPVVNQNYTNEVFVTIRASSVDNLLVYDEVKIIITPSHRTSLDSGLKVYEDGTNIPLSRSGNEFYFTDPHRLVRYNIEYINLEFYPNYNQTFKITNSHNTLIDGKNVYISKGDLTDNSYTNRVNRIAIIIISESGLEEVYFLEVTKALSANSEIGELNVSYDQQTMLNYTYNNNNFTITSRIPYNTTRLYFNPILANNDSVYTKSNFHRFSFNLYNRPDEYIDYIDLPTQSGIILIQMKVTTENNTTKVYDIEVVIGHSNLDSLDDLFIGQNNQPNLISFNPNIHEYSINLPLQYLNNLLLKVSPTLDEGNTQVSRVYIEVDQSSPVETNSILIDIMSGRTVVVYIKVQSEANYHLNIDEYKTYIIYLQSDANDEALLYELEINDNIIKVEDGLDYYSLNFGNGLEVDLITNVKMRLTSSPWSIQEVTYLSYQDYFNLQETKYNIKLNLSYGYYQIPVFQAGIYKIKIRIVAQNNLDFHDYYLELIKEPSINSKVNYIDLRYQNSSILETFLIPDNHETFNYDSQSNTYTLIGDVIVPYSYDNLTIEMNMYRFTKYKINPNPKLYYSYESGNITLDTSKNNIEIEVISEDGNYLTTYILTVVRRYNPDTKYLVEHYLQDFSGSYILFDKLTFTGTAYDEAVAEPIDYDGFTLNLDHFNSVDSGIIEEDGTLVLRLYYSRNSYEFNVIDSENGSVISENGLIKYKYLINLQAIPDQGYRFIGWYDGETIISSNANYQYEMPNRDVSLAARFTERVYYINYELDGGENSSLNKTSYTVNDLPLEIDSPSKIGYQFGGWYLNNNFTGEAIKEITFEILNDYTLYAYWILNENSNYKVEYYLQTFTDNFELVMTKNFNGPTHSLIVLTPEELTGFTFDMANDFNILSGEVLEDGSLTLKVYYLRDSYILDLYNDNPTHGYITGHTGNTLYNQEITIGALPNSGYHFIGWYIDDELISEELDYTFTMPASDLEISARFSIQKYHLIYHLDGGNNHPDNIVEFTIEDFPITLSRPTKEGYTFLGWYLSADFSGLPLEEIVIAEFNNINVYAKWIINTYEVTFVTNISVTQEPLILEYGQKIPVPKIHQLGYRLDNWYLEDNFINPWNFNEDLVSENITLYAKWNLYEYTITYHYDGGILPDGLSNPESFNIESNNIELVNPLKDGYTFIGWYKTADFSGEQVSIIEQGSYGNLNLYAYFMINTYEITFNISGRGHIETNLGIIVDDVLVVEYDTTLTLHFIPDDEYVIDTIKINNEEFDIVTEIELVNINKDYLFEIVFIGDEPEILTLIPGSGYRSNVYSIERSVSDNLFLDYYINQRVSDVKACFVNSPDRIKFFNKNGVELGENSILGTNYIIKLYKDNTYFEVIDEVDVVVLGDTNGDGYINVFDVQDILNHLAGAKVFASRAQLIAANTAKTAFLNVFSVQELLLHLSQVKFLYE